MLLDQTWKLLVQVIGGMSCVRTGKNGLSFARRETRTRQKTDAQVTTSPSRADLAVPVFEVSVGRET